MTLCVKDEGDILDAQLAFHLNAGVDFVIATDTGSTDGTVEILERYRQAGVLELRHDHSQPFRLGDQRTRMARAAATEFDADWVINSDADEFWWPRGYDLKSVLGALPVRYGVVTGLWRPFVPVAADRAPFYERMTVRLTPSHPINDPTSKFRPNTKVAHRADPEVTVGRGNHTSVGSHHLLLRGWYPIEVLHFPFRSPEQLTVKSVKSDTHAGPKRGGYLRRLASEADAQAGDGVFGGMVVDARTLEEGLASGVLVRDLRLRDALRSIVDLQSGWFQLPSESRPGLTLAPPSIVDDASFAAEAAVLGEANLFRALRRLDELERRLHAVERYPAIRASRGLGSLVRRTWPRR
jgi:hypothetical protein